MSITGCYPYPIIIADDHSFLREIIGGYLNKGWRIRVVGRASNGAELIELVRRNFLILITDIKCNSRRNCGNKDAEEKFPEVGVISLTMHSADHLVAEMLESGADGYLLKSIAEEEIIKAIHTVYEGGTYYCSTTSRKVLYMLVKNR
jgi:DNA-binding NarL/FixJ family response regulator